MTVRHGNISKGSAELKAKPGARFRAETFMTTVRRMLLDELKSRGYKASQTFGFITKSGRIALGLSKSHANDAFVIAGSGEHRRAEAVYFIKQARKCNRKLYRGERSHIRNTAARFIQGFQRFDRATWKGEEAAPSCAKSAGCPPLVKHEIPQSKLQAGLSFALPITPKMRLAKRTGRVLWNN